MIYGWISIIALCHITILSGGYLWFFHGNPPAKFLQEVMPTDKKEYMHGEVIELKADYCKYVEKPETVYMQFVDGIVFEVGENKVINSPKGCGKLWNPIIRIPDKLPPGEYFLRGQSVYQVNFLRDRTVEWKSDWFRVLSDR